MLVGRGQGVKGCDSRAIASGVGSASILLAFDDSEQDARTPASVPMEKTADAPIGTGGDRKYEDSLNLVH